MPGHLRRQWVEMTTKDFQQTDMSKVIAVLPVAAIEQHGPHLPVEVDAAINRGVVARALELLPPEMPVTFLPAMPVGKSNEHISYPGTLTLSAETLIRLWTEIGESVAAPACASWCRSTAMAASRRSPTSWRATAGAPRHVRGHRQRLPLGRPAGLFPAAELKHGIHGGSARPRS